LEPTVVDDETLASLAVQTLFVLGENERIYSVEEAMERLERVAPGIERVVFPGVGHDMTWLDPDLVTSKVLEFFDREGKTT
jgi:pimeloyl-ACP methyl ester carboxylesterase